MTTPCPLCLDSPPYAKCAGAEDPCAYVKQIERELAQARAALADYPSITSSGIVVSALLEWQRKHAAALAGAKDKTSE